MRELSIFIDESGSDGLDGSYYLLTLVLHEQGDSLERAIAQYEQSLRDKRLPNASLHTTWTAQWSNSRPWPRK